MGRQTRRPRAQPPAEDDKLTRHWRSIFLGALADTSNVSGSARLAGVTPGHAYKVRRNEPNFAREWLSALCEGYDNLEMELLYRLRHGVGADSDGRKFDNAIAFRQLAMHRESAARHRAMRSNEDSEQVLLSINAKLDLMRARMSGQADEMDGDDDA